MQWAIITGGNKIISYQVIRVEQFTKGSLGKIGAEAERTSVHNRNEDIDSERTPLNLYFKKSEGGLTAQWKKTMQELNATFREKKKSVAFEGMIITSDTAFFERLGWEKGKDTPNAVMEFFNSCYEFALWGIGYKVTDKIILSAVIHLDETTPHLQLYYIPIVDTAKKKVYEKGADGKVKRNEKGSPIQKKDERGKSGDIDLATLNWGNYDLVVIDESHNFRNNKAVYKNKDTRYDFLMKR